MRRVGLYVSCAVAFLAALLLAAPGVLAQGGTTSTISGVVVDTGGGVIPGADVSIKHNATGVTLSAVTNDQGVFSFPGLNIGTYTVTVTLSGFKTFLANDVVITSAAPASVRATLEVGGIEETVTVSSTAAIVQTQSTTISTTVNVNQITKLPLTTRASLDFVTLLPGVTTAGGNRQSQINGLPRGLINITLDGVNVQDNTLRSSDGFFAIVNPRLDAIEEVSVSTASQGADAGQGAVQVRFVTRSGTNTFTGSGYWYMRRDRFNNNTWFNERDNVAKAKLKQDQMGSRVGGPITIPGLFDGRNKAFFFVNWEEYRQPSDVTRNRTVLNTLASQGIYSYSTTSGIRQVNLLALAAANGHISTADPVTSALLADIRTAVSGGALTDLDPNLQRYTYNVPVESMRRYPTVRIDYNFTSNHRFSSAWNYQKFSDYPDTLNSREAYFPGFPVGAGQTSKRYSWSNTLRSTFRSNLVNEVRVGYSGAPVSFFAELTPELWSKTPANQGGFQLTLGSVGSTLTNASAAPSPQARNAWSLLVEDTVNWLKGKHSLNMGVSWTQYTYWGWFETMVPTVSFGLVTGDPALAMFNSTNFPGAASTNLTAAQNLYALLTGRVSQIAGNARLDEDTNKYTYVGRGMQRARMPEFGFFAQDSWRLKPNFTVNLGLRYALQLPFYPLNDSYTTATLADLCGISGLGSDGRCNLFQPGVLTGKTPEFTQYTKGTKGYNTDWNNFSPTVGFAWTTGGQAGLLGKLLGQQGDSVVRAGFSRAYSRNGMSDFTGRFGSNPGAIITVSRNAALGNLGTLPLLFRETNRLGPPPFAETPVYPMTDVVTGDINLFDPDIKVPYADSYTVGLQRALGRSMAVEVRYVGTRSRDGWANLNYNEINIFENGFLSEFRAAQANLQANIAAGRGSNFRYYGPGTGTSPLPIMLAYFSGLSAANAGDPARYTSANFASNTFLNPLAMFNPNVFSFASNLYTNASLRGNAATAGLPVNFFIMNPDLQGGALLTQNRNETNYHALQVELRRRLSQGLQFQSSYAFGKMMMSRWETFRKSDIWVRDVGSPGDITHVFKANVVYDLPFGQGRRFGGNVNAVVDRIIGGWTLALVSRVQSGQLVDLGNVRLVGMSAKDVAGLYKVRIDADKRVYILPQDVIDNTIKAFSVSATSPTGYGTLGPPSGRYFAPANGPDCIEVDNGANYGDCGVRSLVVPGPMFQEHDITVSKRITIKGRTNLELRAEILNAFNNTNFVPVGGLGTQLASYEITSLTGTNTARVMQFIVRFNW
ncbi:MAG: carboxypeptidase regulatory-like domain-containing protein [Acidobacteriota bacterium]